MDSLTYWEKQPTDQPHLLNGFKGTWAFSDHNLIPDALRNFIIESFPKIERFKRIPLDEINALMNEVWEGPGSMVKIEKLFLEMKSERLSRIKSGTNDNSDVKTLDDFSEEEMTSKAFDDGPAEQKEEE